MACAPSPRALACLAVAVMALVLLGDAAAAVGPLAGRAQLSLGVAPPPFTLLAGVAGVTTLGPAATSASTTSFAASRTDDLLALRSHAAAPLSAQLRLVGASGDEEAKRVRITLQGEPQLALRDGAWTSVAGAPVTLAPGATLRVEVSAQSQLVQSMTLVVALDVASAGGPVATAQWTLTLV